MTRLYECKSGQKSGPGERVCSSCNWATDVVKRRRRWRCGGTPSVIRDRSYVGFLTPRAVEKCVFFLFCVIRGIIVVLFTVTIHGIIYLVFIKILNRHRVYACSRCTHYSSCIQSDFIKKNCLWKLVPSSNLWKTIACCSGRSLSYFNDLDFFPIVLNFYLRIYFQTIVLCQRCLRLMI